MEETKRMESGGSAGRSTSTSRSPAINKEASSHHEKEPPRSSHEDKAPPPGRSTTTKHIKEEPPSDEGHTPPDTGRSALLLSCIKEEPQSDEGEDLPNTQIKVEPFSGDPARVHRPPIKEEPRSDGEDPTNVDILLPVDHTQDLPNDHTHGLPIDHTQGLPLDHTQDLHLDHTQDLPIDHTMGLPIDHTQCLPVNHTQCLPVDHTQCLPVDHTKGLRVYHTHGLAIDHTHGLPVENTQGLPIDHAQCLPIDHTQDLPIHHTQGLPVDHTQGLAIHHTQGLPVDHTHGPSVGIKEEEEDFPPAGIRILKGIITDSDIHSFTITGEYIRGRKVKAKPKQDKMAAAASSSKHPCPVCKKGFSTHGNMVRHREFHNGKKMCCGVCGAEFCSKMDLKAHAQTHKVSKVLHCSQCDVTFPGNVNPIVQKRIHTGVKLLACSQCGKRFSSKPSATEHMSKLYLCLLCGKHVAHKALLLRHERVHAGGDPVCSDCNVFKMAAPTIGPNKDEPPPGAIKEEPQSGEGHAPQSGLEDHRENVLSRIKEEPQSDEGEDPPNTRTSHPPPEIKKEHQSPDREDPTHMDLPAHPSQSLSNPIKEEDEGSSGMDILKRTITDSDVRYFTVENKRIKLVAPPPEVKGQPSKNNHLCPVCQRNFSSHGNMVRHREFHNGKKLCCPVCGAEFCSKMDLKAHVQIHKVSNVLYCAECNVITPSTLSVLVHEKIHTGGKPFCCAHCAKRFASQSQVSQHMSQPYSCIVCQKVFTHKALLLRHERTHIDGKPVCSDCNIWNMAIPAVLFNPLMPAPNKEHGIVKFIQTPPTCSTNHRGPSLVKAELLSPNSLTNKVEEKPGTPGGVPPNPDIKEEPAEHPVDPTPSSSTQNNHSHKEALSL